MAAAQATQKQKKAAVGEKGAAAVAPAPASFEAEAVVAPAAVLNRPLKEHSWNDARNDPIHQLVHDQDAIAWTGGAGPGVLVLAPTHERTAKGKIVHRRERAKAGGKKFGRLDRDPNDSDWSNEGSRRSLGGESPTDWKKRQMAVDAVHNTRGRASLPGARRLGGGGGGRAIDRAHGSMVMRSASVPLARGSPSSTMIPQSFSNPFQGKILYEGKVGTPGGIAGHMAASGVISVLREEVFARSGSVSGWGRGSLSGTGPLNRSTDDMQIDHSVLFDPGSDSRVDVFGSAAPQDQARRWYVKGSKKTKMALNQSGELNRRESGGGAEAEEQLKGRLVHTTGAERLVVAQGHASFVSRSGAGRERVL